MRLVSSSATSRSRAGSALVAALGVVALLAVLSVAYLNSSLSRSTEGAVAADSKRAFYMAEAGLAEAYQGLRSGKSGNVGSDLVPARFGNGVFWVVAERAGPGRLSLKSTGLCGRGRAALSVVVENTGESVAALGVFTGQSMVVQPGCLIDSFDSRDGRYSAQTSGSEARVGSNANVSVQATAAAATTIRGDATPGPTGQVTRATGATITGSTAPRAANEELPEILIPEIPSSGSIVYTNSRTPLRIDGGAHAWHTVQIQSRAAAVVLGPATVVVDRLQIDSGASLSLDCSAGPVALFVRGQLVLASGSRLATPAALPSGVTLLVNSESGLDLDGDGRVDVPVTLGASGEFHGTLYAPHADVTVPSTLEIFGALSARSLIVSQRARIHFDRALTAAVPGEGVLPNTLCWRVVELPPVPLVRQRRDPLSVLARAGVTPIDACDAHFPIGVLPPSSDPTVNLFSGGLAGTGMLAAAAAAPPPVASAADSAVIALIDDPARSSAQLTSDLLAASPLSSAVITRAISRNPPLTSADARTVLLANGPLPDLVLAALALGLSPLTSADLRDVLVGSSPLSPSVLSIATMRSPAVLSAADLATVVAAQ